MWTLRIRARRKVVHLKPVAENNNAIPETRERNDLSSLVFRKRYTTCIAIDWHQQYGRRPHPNSTLHHEVGASNDIFAPVCFENANRIGLFFAKPHH
jgi:hypothetical protein